MTMPATLEICARIRNGRPCLGLVHRSGVPEIVTCTACGTREAGQRYAHVPQLVDAIERYLVETLGGNHPHLAEAYRHAATNVRAFVEGGAWKADR